MAIPYHTHNFTIQTADAEETAAGTLDDVLVTPKSLKPSLDKTKIRGMDEKTDAVTYETLTALAEEDTDNEKVAVKRLFEAGGTMAFRAQVDAQGATIPAAVKRTVIDNVNYVRSAVEPSHGLKYRSTDRWTDEGDHDSSNGGWWEIDERVVTPSMAGAKLDGLTDDTAAFARYESYAEGALTDLGGKMVTVDAVPTKARYWNGGFKVGGELISTPAAQRVNPFLGRATVAAGYPGTFWPAGVWFDANNKVLYRVDVIAERHDGTSGARLDLTKSFDMGETWVERQTLFSDPSNPRVRAGAFGIMSSGRWGGVVSTGDTTRKQWFIYTDDSAATWSIVDITAQVPIANHFVYGMLLPGPSGLDGDFIVSSYGGTAAAKLLRTTDNGAGWADYELKTAAGLPGTSPNPAEQSIVNVPGKGWLMFTRVENTPAAAQNMFAAVSMDGISYGPWIDTGIMLGANPVHAIYDGGQIHVLCAQRTGFPGTLRPDTLTCYSVDANRLFDNPAMLAGIAPQLVASFAQRAIGYMQSCRLAMSPDDKVAPWYHVLKSEEASSTLRATSSKLITIRDLPGADNRPSADASLQLIHNPIFSQWPRGTSFTVTGSDAPTAARWRSVRSGAASYVMERVTLTSDQVKRFPFRPQYGMRLSNTGSPENFVGLSQRWLGDHAKYVLRALMSGGAFVCRVYGVGSFPSTWTASLATDAGAFASVTFKAVPSGQTASWVVEGRMLNSATPPDPASVSYVQFSMGNGDAVSEFDFTVVGVFLYPAALTPAMEFNEPADTFAVCERYCRTHKGMGTRVGRGVLRGSTSAVVSENIYPPMMGPLASVAFSDLSHWTVESAADLTPSAITPSFGSEQVSYTCTVAGGTTGQPACLRAVDANASITIDTLF